MTNESTYISMLKKNIKSLIEGMVLEEIGALTMSYAFGKDRNGGNIHPPETHWQNPKTEYAQFAEEFKSIFPEIKTYTEYEIALKLVASLDPQQDNIIFKIYDILWPVLQREGWSGEEDNAEAARAVFDAITNKV